MIIDDNVLEENEIFFLLINPISLPNGVTTSGDSQVTVTIVNDDGKATCVATYLEFIMHYQFTKVHV